MARKPRIHVAGAFYHTVLRCVDDQALFFTDEHRRYIEALVAAGLSRFDHRIHSYCWMDDLIHLVVQVGSTPLSKVVQQFTIRYTRWFNRQLQRSGPLFLGRYKAVLIDADTYLLELIRYIHLTPAREGLVQDPADWPWSSHRAYLGLIDIPWLTTERVYGLLAQDFRTERERYAQFMVAADRNGGASLLGNTKQGRILGDSAFIEDKLLQANLQPVIVRLETVVTAVCAARKFDLATLAAPARGRSAAEARALIAYLAREKCPGALSRLARLFNRDIATLSNAANRIRLRLKTEPELVAEVQHLYGLLDMKDRLSQPKK